MCICGHVWPEHEMRCSDEPNDVWFPCGKCKCRFFSLAPEPEAAIAEPTTACVELAQTHNELTFRRCSAALGLARERIAELEAQLASANAELARRIAADHHAHNALDTLQEMTGSDNQENPWLGVAASVALLQLRREKAEAQLADFKRGLDGESAFLSKDDLVTTLVERARAAEARAEALRTALEQVEWVRNVDHWLICPWCEADKRQGHKPDCARQLALGREAKAK